MACFRIKPDLYNMQHLEKGKIPVCTHHHGYSLCNTGRYFVSLIGRKNPADPDDSRYRDDNHGFFHGAADRILQCSCIQTYFKWKTVKKTVILAEIIYERKSITAVLRNGVIL